MILTALLRRRLTAMVVMKSACACLAVLVLYYALVGNRCEVSKEGVADIQTRWNAMNAHCRSMSSSLDTYSPLVVNSSSLLPLITLVKVELATVAKVEGSARSWFRDNAHEPWQ